MNEQQNINQLPKEWKSVKLGEVCDIQTGKYDANHAKAAGKYRFYTCAFEYMYCDTNRFKGESLILPGNGANVGEVFYYNGEFDAYQRTYVLNKIKTNPKYLYYHLLCNWRKRNQDKQFGSATNYIRMGNFTDYELPIPPNVIQEVVVSKIEELLSELDKGIENLRTAQQQLKTYRQSVLKWAFEGKLTNKNVKEGELPKGWKMTKLGEYIEDISSGKSYRCDERPPKQDEVGIVKVSSVTWGFFDEMESKTCFSKDFLNTKYLIKNRDFLFSRANTIEFIGACVIVNKIDKNLMLSDKILRFTFSKDVSKEYALYYLRSRKGRKQIETLSTGNQDSMRNIGQEKIRQIEFPYCSIKEQNNIVEEIESRLSVADKMGESITQSLQQAEALRQSILKKAFEGKLVATDTITIEEIKQKSKIIPLERKVLAGKIIHLLHEDRYFGLTKFQKILYLVENFAEVQYETNFIQERAGPYDKEFTALFRKEMQEKDWVQEEQKGSIAKFIPSENIGSLISGYATYFREKGKQIVFIVQQLKDKSTHDAELIATVYAVWNNSLIKKKPIKIDLIVEDFFNWSPKKKEEFQEEEIVAIYNWMKEIKLMPKGFGKVIGPVDR